MENDEVTIKCDLDGLFITLRVYLPLGSKLYQTKYSLLITSYVLIWVVV